MTDVNPPKELLLGTAGWARPDWAAPYYPDDLPADWRLDYYANDCDCVLLTPDDWGSLDAERFADQLDELASTFRCFVQLHGGTDPGDVAFVRGLDARRVVLLVDRVDPSFTTLPQWPLRAADSWCDPHGPGCVVRWVIDGFDLRALRLRVGVLDPRACALVIDGPHADPGRIPELRTLLELMGRA